jgi:hypothetical protein
MRTTVEITEPQRQALTALAQRRGIRGFSPLIQEALDAYLGSVGADETEVLLSLEGSFTDADARTARSRVADIRKTWRAS